MENRISIVIPIYNRGYCLHRCLDSVLKQTLTDWECILVDDASTDNSLLVCNEYVAKDSRFQVVKQPENGGVSIARNRGLDLAKGEYIAFIDSDDWIEPDYLSALYSSAEVKIMPLGAMIVHNKKGEIYGKCMLDKTSRLCTVTDLLLEFLDTVFFNSPCCRLYNRMIIEEHHLRFQSRVSWGEDLIFNCSYFEYIENVICVSAFYHIMEQEVSLSSSFHKNPLLVENNMKLWHSVYALWEKLGIRNKKIDSILLDYHSSLLWQPIDIFYRDTGFSVSCKDRLSFIRHIMKYADDRVIKRFIIPRSKSQLRSFLVYYRMDVLFWLLCECLLLIKKK